MSDVISDEEAIIKRREMFNAGQYELADDEGFKCEECGWRGLTAPMSDYSMYEITSEDKPVCKCPECESDVKTFDSEIDYLEQFKEDYYVRT